MSLLPSFIDDDEEIVQEEETYTMPVEYGIDFATGQLTGKKVSGKEAIKVWIWLAFRAERFRYPIYTWDYGIELEEYVGQPNLEEFADTDIKESIKEALLINPYITAITDWSSRVDGERLYLDFTVETDYGELEVSEIV